MQITRPFAALLLATSSLVSAADYPLKPVPFNKVEMTSDFWRPRLETQRKTLVPFAFEKTQPGVEHLQAARDFLAGKKVEDHRAHRFIDSDLYKVMEGAAYLLQLRSDPELEKTLDDLADVIAGAQHENGYLYPSHTTGAGSSKHMMGDKPYTFIVHSHELYNVGHLYEAAIAYYQATGKRKLLDVAEKSAQHINKVIFEGDTNYNDGKPIRQAPGHQEMELALVKLYRVTGKQLYLDMARQFLEIRGVTYVPDGDGVMSPTYAQQHAPVIEQKEAVGHAVRATYLYSAMADVGTLTGDARYGKALDNIWGDITNTRMHITGGLGAVHGIEGFGPQYELPNADAFNETCAAVGNVLFNYRMFLLHKDARYLDVAEVALLNNVLAAVNLEGNRFFYVNPLDADGKYPFNHGTAGRAPWFGTACCPSNMARLLPQVPGMTYAHDENNLYITFFAESRTEIELNGTQVKVEQKTAYPNDGEISVAINPAKPTRFRLRLRIPTWTQERFVPGDLYRFVDTTTEPVHLTVNSQDALLQPGKGFLVIDREWQPGDRVVLNLPMPVRVTECHPAVKANGNRIAFTRGPFVLCAEGVDNGGATQRFFFEQSPDTAKAKARTTRTESGSFIQADISAQAVTKSGETVDTKLTLTPYYAWNNRGAGSMTVWFPTRADMAVFDPLALPKESVFASITASHTADEDTLTAIGDGRVDKWSSGNKVTRWTSRGQPGKEQWIIGRFRDTKNIRSVGVFWMDRWQGDVKLPKEWSLEIEQNGKWKPFELYTTDKYDTRANQFNVVHPAVPTKCDAVRIRMTPRDDTSVGILEVEVAFEKESLADPLPLKTKVLPVVGLPSREPSGLTIHNGTLYTVCDKTNEILRIELTKGQAQLHVHRKIRLDGGVNADFEGITCDDEGNFYLVSEKYFSILKVSADLKQVSWVSSGLRSKGQKVGLFKVKNAFLEGIAWVGNGKLVLCAERDPRGILVVDTTKDPSDPTSVVAVKHTAVGVPFSSGRSPDFSGLFWDRQLKKLFVVQKNAHVICQLVSSEDGYHEKDFWSFAASEPVYEEDFGKAEGLCMDADHIYVILDNNNQRVVEVTANGRRPTADRRSRLLIMDRAQAR